MMGYVSFALTLTLSLREREQPVARCGFSNVSSTLSAWQQQMRSAGAPREARAPPAVNTYPFRKERGAG